MAFCPECKKQISDAAVICPHCKCDIERYKDNLKAERERKEAERREKARLAAEEKRKAEELADRLICPDCATAVTLEDEICPKCGFPLDDKGERIRMKMWQNIRKSAVKPGLYDRWFAPIMIGFIVACIISYIITCLSDTFEIFLSYLPIPIIIGIAVTAVSVMPSFTKASDAKEKNFEEFMIENENLSAATFAGFIKQRIVHCPFCQRKLTEKSVTYWGNSKTDIKEIRCEHCGKLIDFPGDRMREQFEQDKINRNWRRSRWGL